MGLRSAVMPAAAVDKMSTAIPPFGFYRGTIKSIKTLWLLRPYSMPDRDYKPMIKIGGSHSLLEENAIPASSDRLGKHWKNISLLNVTVFL